MRLRTSPQSNSPQGSHRLVGCSSFNEAADFAAEQPQQSAYPPQPNPSFNEAADFAAEQLGVSLTATRHRAPLQ